MNLRDLLGVAVASLALGSVLSSPVSAQMRDPFEKLEAISPEVLFKGLIREDDVTLLFQHIRESMAATARGEAAVPSEAMARRGAQIQREVAARGGVLMGVLLSAFEQAAKQMVRDGLGELRAPAPRHSPHVRPDSRPDASD